VACFLAYSVYLMTGYKRYIAVLHTYWMIITHFFVRRLKRKVGRVFWDGRFIYVLPGTDCKQWSQKVARTATVINCLENLHSRQKPALRPFAGRHNNARLSVPWELLVYCGCTACIYCLQTADRGDSENLASSFSLYDTTQGRLSMKILKGGIVCICQYGSSK